MSWLPIDPIEAQLDMLYAQSTTLAHMVAVRRAWSASLQKSQQSKTSATEALNSQC
jgi:uncharacterized damage-inducible protein DinB